MNERRKARICALLKGIETGDPASVEVISQVKYIQHNPQTDTNRDGLVALFKQLAKTSPRVNIVRIFSDGDYIFGHTEYDFASRRIGFEIFRFEGELAVEHWDNIQLRKGPNRSGHSMVDGVTEVCDLERTDTNREIVRRFIDEVLIQRRFDRLVDYIVDDYTEHNPSLADGRDAVRAALAEPVANDGVSVRYERLHRLLAEGNFVLSVCEGRCNEAQASFFDLYRLQEGLLVEHWDTTEMVPPASEWKNHNGKF